MQLSDEEKVQLAEELLASVDPREQASIEAAWVEEAERRIDDIDAGRTKMSDADEVIERIRKSLT